jgi:hypothetical protein
MSPRRSKTEIRVLDPNLTPLATQLIDERYLEPVTCGSELFWRNEAAMFAAYPSGAKLEAHFGPSPLDVAQETYSFFGLQSNAGARQWMVLEDYSEAITILNQDGAPMAAAEAPLDEAYRAAGLVPFPAHSNWDGLTRIGWAAVSGGYLYVGLGIRPIALPEYIAVIEPLTGRLVKVLAAELPTTPARVTPDNPKGFMIPTRVAVGEQLVLVDLSARLLIEYLLE